MGKKVKKTHTSQVHSGTEGTRSCSREKKGKSDHSKSSEKQEQSVNGTWTIRWKKGSYSCGGEKEEEKLVNSLGGWVEVRLPLKRKTPQGGEKKKHKWKSKSK